MTRKVSLYKTQTTGKHGSLGNQASAKSMQPAKVPQSCKRGNQKVKDLLSCNFNYFTEIMHSQASFNPPSSSMLEQPPALTRKMNKFFTRNEPIQVSQKSWKSQRKSKPKMMSSQRHSAHKEVTSVTESSTTAAPAHTRSRNYRHEVELMTEQPYQASTMFNSQSTLPKATVQESLPTKGPPKPFQYRKVYQTQMMNRMLNKVTDRLKSKGRNSGKNDQSKCLQSFKKRSTQQAQKAQVQIQAIRDKVLGPNRSSVLQSTAPTPSEVNKGKKEAAVHQERDRECEIVPFNQSSNQVISNRVRILAQKTQARRFVHKDLKLYDATFDPLRSMIIEMNVTKAKVLQGKTSEYYFIQSCKLCSRNQITDAIESLNKGLVIDPGHFLCRFNHGVLMFKLGLYSQARVDFEMLCTRYPKELAPKFNLALILLQLGEFHLSIDYVSDLIEESQKSPECRSLFNMTDNPNLEEDDIGVLRMMQNAYLLMARCYWRTGSALKAVKCYNQSQRYSYSRSEKARELTSEELLLLIRN